MREATGESMFVLGTGGFDVENAGLRDCVGPTAGEKCEIVGSRGKGADAEVEGGNIRDFCVR